LTVGGGRKQRKGTRFALFVEILGSGWLNARGGY